MELEIKRNESPNIYEIGALTGQSASRIETALKNTYAVFSVRKEKELIAFARVISDGTIYSFIVDLNVSSKYRKQGIGKQLVKHIMAELKKDGIRYTELTFEHKNLERFYKECGFQIENAGSVLNE